MDMSVLDTTSSQIPAAIDESHPDTFEMDDTLVGHDEDVQPQSRKRGMLDGVARHTLGLILLLCVVFLWTLSNFLGSVRLIHLKGFQVHSS